MPDFRVLLNISHSPKMIICYSQFVFFFYMDWTKTWFSQFRRWQNIPTFILIELDNPTIQYPTRKRKPAVFPIPSNSLRCGPCVDSDLTQHTTANVPDNTSLSLDITLECHTTGNKTCKIMEKVCCNRSDEQHICSILWTSYQSLAQQGYQEVCIQRFRCVITFLGCDRMTVLDCIFWGEGCSYTVKVSY